MRDLLGREHTLLNAVAHPVIAAWIAPYAFANQVTLSARN
jgi:hypothetical protein